MLKTTWVAVALAVSLALAATPAGAIIIPIAPGDFDLLELGLGAPSVGPTTSEFRSVPPEDRHIADLTATVWPLVGGSYLYGLAVDPVVLTTAGGTEERHNISIFSTAYAVGGFSPVAGAAGFSFSDAGAAGAPAPAASAFDVEYNTVSGRISWLVSEALLGTAFWDSGARLVPITFYFISSLPPGENNVYSLINTPAGETINSAPAPVAVPEPASLLLVVSGVLGFGVIGRRFFLRGGSEREG